MAETPIAKLQFNDDEQEVSCFSCAERVYHPRPPLPEIGDDFDWGVRDYDGYRQFIIEELAARFPERESWTPADPEIALAEVLSASLDHLSDMTDRVFAEGYLQTARHPQSVRRHLSAIGYDAVAEADALDQIEINPATTPQEANALLDQFWSNNPYAMEQARQAGPKSIHIQKRMVTLSDYAERLEDHPLVVRAIASAKWRGTWTTIFTAVIPIDTGTLLDDVFEDEKGIPGTEIYRRRKALKDKVEAFYERNRLPIPDWSQDPTLRTLLRPYIDLQRMAGQEVVLQDPIRVGITIVITISVNANYFASEIDRAAKQVLGTEIDGYFSPGRLQFGEDVFASDIIAAIMQIEGVDNVCIVRFKRTGDRFPDQSASGRIRLSGLEIAVCDNNRADMEMGYTQITTKGGLSG